MTLPAYCLIELMGQARAVGLVKNHPSGGFTVQPYGADEYGGILDLNDDIPF